MAKNILRIVLTGGPAAGKTTLISRVLKEFTREKGWRVITIPETATELISGFGLGPFEGCMSMHDFQYFVIGDQLHKEQLALKGAATVPDENVLILYDRAVFDDKAYVSDAEFSAILGSFGKTEAEMLSGYDAVLHLVSCAKGAESAYNYGNAARYEDVETARKMDDLTLRAWSAHPNRFIIDNSVDFEDKLRRAIAAIYRVAGEPVPDTAKRKYLVAMPDCAALTRDYGADTIDMMQTYLIMSNPNAERRIRQRRSGDGYIYFYTEKRRDDTGKDWVTERPISEKDYVAYLMEADTALHPVRKQKYTFTCNGSRMELDVYPFCSDRAVLFVYGDRAPEFPSGIQVLKEVSGDPAYKNRKLAETQQL